MKVEMLLTLTIFFFRITSCYSADNSNKDSFDSLIIKMNNLPKTAILEDGSKQKYQTEYTFKYNKKKNQLKIIENRYFINTPDQPPMKTVNVLTLDYIHPLGVYLDYQKDSSMISLKIFTAKNLYKIKTRLTCGHCAPVTYFTDRTEIGSWETDTNLHQIKQVSLEFSKLIDQTTDWNIDDIPNFYCSIQPELTNTRGLSTIHWGSYTEPIFLNNLIDSSSLFLNSHSENENRILIKEHVVKELKKMGIKYEGEFIGFIIISASGEILEFKSLDKNTPYLEKKIKEIILSLPKWKPGVHYGKKVKTTQTVILEE